MLLALAFTLVLTYAVQRHIRIIAQQIKGFRMHFCIIFCNLLDTNTANTADCIGKIFINKGLFQTQCFKYLGTLIRLNGRNTHLRCNLNNPRQYTVTVCFYCRIVILLKHIILNQLMDARVCQIWVHRTGSVTEKGREFMYSLRFASFNNDSYSSTFLGSYQMLLYPGYCKQ